MLTLGSELWIIGFRLFLDGAPLVWGRHSGLLERRLCNAASIFSDVRSHATPARAAPAQFPPSLSLGTEARRSRAPPNRLSQHKHYCCRCSAIISKSIGAVGPANLMAAAGP
ncbi:hypothetical protein EVAR_42758_1 [Eumeta japonica]|uniref:Uncharacterized protein n=1 Tax=Eumeta variegata TaxID=151549 RepID=A0A4C1WN78_EUMVA|nr:hypothetical protein EVAR_42758_1 [Eumeta japonica]